MESYALLIAATLNAGTVLAIAALGLLINEKVGVVNLGAEGMMLCAAIAGFACVVHTGNDWLGFAAIIVAFVGRLHPAGMVLSAVLMSMFYIGGELAQSRMGLPKSITGVFQGLLLFCLLACDTLVAYRLRWVSASRAAPKKGGL